MFYPIRKFNFTCQKIVFKKIKNYQSLLGSYPLFYNLWPFSGFSRGLEAQYRHQIL